MSEPSGNGANNHTDDPTANPPERNRPVGDQFPLDPLLRPGEYIDGGTDNREDKNRVVDHTESHQVEPPNSASDEQRKCHSVAEPTTATPQSQQRRRRPPEDMAAMGERPEWLPAEWKTYTKTRSSGASAGTVDRLKGVKHVKYHTGLLEEKFSLPDILKL
ncbi:unnamed protein product [Ilex paraguariensis]|uniref:Uncharacterized protein n=1 Tax=Ilex paraguariensis TaxID=185542 RepID=A0ABC8SPN0_9AQUA